MTEGGNIKREFSIINEEELLEPQTKKVCLEESKKEFEEDERSIRYSLSSHKGRRESMEDAHLILTDSELHGRYSDLGSELCVHIFGIFDGHGGRRVADFVCENFSDVFIPLLIKRFHKVGRASSKVVVGGIEISFRRLEGMIEERAKEEGWKDGCCAVMLFLINTMAYVANLGDSKVVVCQVAEEGDSEDVVPRHDVGGSSSANSQSKHSFPWETSLAIPPPPPSKALELTIDHSTLFISERERVEAAGGRIMDGRVNGILQITRSFGDVALKKFPSI